MLGANDVRFSRLMDRREAPGRKRMAIRSPDGAARHPISSPPTPFLLCHLLFPPTTFVRFASVPSVVFSRSRSASGANQQQHVVGWPVFPTDLREYTGSTLSDRRFLVAYAICSEHPQ